MVFNLDFRCLKDSWWWKFLENGYFFEKVPSLSNRDVVLVSLTVTVFQMMICTPSYLNSHFRSTYFIFQNYSFAAREPRGKMLLVISTFPFYVIRFLISDQAWLSSFLIFKGTLFFDEQESVKSEVGKHYSASFAFLFSELHSLSKLHLFKPPIFYLSSIFVNN